MGLSLATIYTGNSQIVTEKGTFTKLYIAL